MATDPHHITLAQAIDLTTRWRTNNPTAIHGGLFYRIALDKLLAKEGCAGIRIYMGQQPAGDWTFVLVATDAANNDIITEDPSDLAASDRDPGDCDTEEDPLLCPPFCDCDSPLNGDC